MKKTLRVVCKVLSVITFICINFYKHFFKINQTSLFQTNKASYLQTATQKESLFFPNSSLNGCFWPLHRGRIVASSAAISPTDQQIARRSFSQFKAIIRSAIQTYVYCPESWVRKGKKHTKEIRKC